MLLGQGGDLFDLSACGSARCKASPVQVDRTGEKGLWELLLWIWGSTIRSMAFWSSAMILLSCQMEAEVLCTAFSCDSWVVLAAYGTGSAKIFLSSPNI